MRNWTTFLIFGGILLVMLLFWGLSVQSTSHNPIIQSTQKFLTAVEQHDIATAKSLLEPDAGSLTTAGDQITGITFNQAKPFEGAFIKYDAVTWTPTQLTGVEVDMQSDPRSSDGYATVKLMNNESVFLHQTDGEWKVIYITQTKPETPPMMKP